MSTTQVVAALALVAACGAAQSDDARLRNALSQSPPMVNPAVTGVADAAVSSSWDSTYRMLSFSPSEVCFLAEWDVPSSLAPSVRFVLEGWRSLDEDRSKAPKADSTSMALVSEADVRAIKASDAPVHDDTPEEIRMMRPKLTAMRVCFASSVIRPETRYLMLQLSVDESNGRHHETGAGWQLVARR